MNIIIRAFLFFLACLCVLGCRSKSGKHEADASIESALMVIRHQYFYDDTVLRSETSLCSQYLGGVITERIVTITTKVYDNKARLVQELTQTTIDSVAYKTKSSDTSLSKVYYRYDTRDSVIEKLSLDKNGDTSSWAVYDFFPDGKKVIKGVTEKFDISGSANMLVLDSLRKSYYERKYTFKNGLCVGEKEFDARGVLVKSIVINYDRNNGNKPTKRIISDYSLKSQYPFSDSSYSNIITYYYSYNTTGENTDYYAIDAKGDTVCVKTSFYSDGGHLQKSVLVNYDDRYMITTYYNTAALVVRDVFVSWVDGSRNVRTSVYYYYANGKLKEEVVKYKKVM